MTHYISTRGDSPAVPFDSAVIDGFAPDGGLYVPETIPRFTPADLQELASLAYPELAQEIIRKFIPESLLSDKDLKNLLLASFTHFSSEDTVPIVHLKQNDIFIQELFHGPTLSFKDIAMGFLINCLDYFLTKRGERLSLVLATTGDTGPAAAYAAAGKKSLECWPLYPRDMISEEQERQMTTLDADNVHPVGVEGCLNGGDDLDIVVAELFADVALKEQLKLSSVNSINWCRVMVQTIHYFSAYFKTVDRVGERISVSVPSGAFGNLCAGYIAREMGLPISQFICATNANATMHRVFNRGIFSKQKLKQTVSSAIDIVIPYNFWRFLYLKSNHQSEFVKASMSTFINEGSITFTPEFHETLCDGFTSYAISDTATLKTISSFYQAESYLLDPHGAVAVAAAKQFQRDSGSSEKIVCLATAHPAKFPQIIKDALGIHIKLPPDATHPRIEEAKRLFHHRRLFQYETLFTALPQAIREQLYTEIDGAVSKQ